MTITLEQTAPHQWLAWCDDCETGYAGRQLPTRNWANYHTKNTHTQDGDT